NALLPVGERIAVEGVRFLGGREAGILPDRPGPAGIHRRARAAQKGLQSRQRMHLLEAGNVLGRVERLDVDALRRAPDQRIGLALDLLLGERAPGGELGIGHTDLLRGWRSTLPRSVLPDMSGRTEGGAKELDFKNMTVTRTP